jgi:phosphotriesterase-related protein
MSGRYRMKAALALGALGLASSAQGQQTPRIPNLEGKILTVAGPIDPSAAGPTLMHEHIFIEFKAPASAIPQPGAPMARPGPGALKNFDESLAEIMEFKKIGGGTIVDASNFGLGREPSDLRRVAQASGLNVVMGSGYYQKALHPPDFSERTVDELMNVIVGDVAVGAQGTDIRAGMIGEVGVEGRPLTANEIKSVQASARAARLTGAPLAFHFGGFTLDEKLRVLDLVEAEGVDLSRVVMAHNGFADMATMKRLFDKGVFVEFDFIGSAPLRAQDADRLVQQLSDVIAVGFGGQLLVSHDICTPGQFKKNGGGGYAYISSVILPGLKQKGVADADIQKILVDNPRRALTFAAPQPLL